MEYAIITKDYQTDWFSDLAAFSSAVESVARARDFTRFIISLPETATTFLKAIGQILDRCQIKVTFSPDSDAKLKDYLTNSMACGAVGATVGATAGAYFGGDLFSMAVGALIGLLGGAAAGAALTSWGLRIRRSPSTAGNVDLEFSRN